MIKNLLFDLGGVIMDIRRENCVAAYERLGMTQADDLLGEYSQKGPFKKIENGEFTPAQFRAEMRRYLRDGVTDSEIDQAFLAFLTGIPGERLRRLEQLKQRYKLYLLSNTNPIMWESKIADEFRKDGHEREFYFEGMVTSFEAGVMKPDEAIFHRCVEQFGIRPEETLFFDDSETNVRAAGRMGFHGCLVRPGEEFFDLLDEIENR